MSKLRKHFLDDLEVEHIVLHAFRFVIVSVLPRCCTSTSLLGATHIQTLRIGAHAPVVTVCVTSSKFAQRFRPYSHWGVMMSPQFLQIQIKALLFDTPIAEVLVFRSPCQTGLLALATGVTRR